MKTAITIIKHELKLSLRKSGGTISLLMFFIIAVSLFSFGMGPDPVLLSKVSTGVIWVCALLSSMLSIPSVFDEDFEDGSLSQLLLQGYLPEVIVISKIISHWIISGLPLIVISPLLAVFLNMDEGKIIFLIITLIIGMPILSLIGSVGAALTLGLKRGGGLVGLLVLPLYIPVLIFAVATVDGADEGVVSSLLLMTGLFLFMLPVGVMACSAAVKVAVEEG